MKIFLRNKLLIGIFLLAVFLRFFLLSSFPPGLYSDEAALGYNAYSIMKTGRDEFEKYLPLTLRSFGDYKPPLSAYIMISSIRVFGLNEFSVRFPFALLGSLSVITIYFLALNFFPKNKNRETIALIAALLLTVSPWHLHQSRMAMLVGAEAFFNSLGVLLFLVGTKKKKYLFLSAISFSLAVYAYYGSRVTAPLLILSLLFIYRNKIFREKTKFLIFLSGFVIILPLVIAIFKDPETLLGRARYMSIFHDKNVWGQLWEASTLDGPDFPSVISRFFHNKPFFYGRDIFQRWLQHFNFDYLFTKGDGVAPFQIPNMGILYFSDLPFLLIGIFLLIKKRSQENAMIFCWLLISPFVAALTFMTPASNRSFNAVFPFCLIVAFGIVSVAERFRKRYLTVGIVVIYFFSTAYYFVQYYYNIPRQIPLKYHYGRRELVSSITAIQNNYNKIIISDKGGPPYIFLLFFEQYDSREYWRTMKVNPVITDLGWGHIDGFGKYIIPRDFNWKNAAKTTDALYVGFEEEVPDIWQEPVGGRQLKVRVLKKILYPNGKTAFKLFDLIPA